MEEVFEANVILKYDENLFITFDNLLQSIKDGLPNGIDINCFHSKKITIILDTKYFQMEIK